MKDPYLIPGQICEVWNDSNQYIDLGYFIKEEDGTFLFSSNKHNGVPDISSSFLSSGYYKPIGTEWDYAPDWAVCSTVDSRGHLKFWNTKDIVPLTIKTKGLYPKEIWAATGNKHENMYVKKISCGEYPDKTRYQGAAWKGSLRMRPSWAKVEK